MHISLAISFAVQGFFPNRDEKNNIIYTFENLSEFLPLFTFALSVLSSSFGMSKFLLDGPIRFLPKNYPFGGLLSPRFIGVCFVNMMFGARIICLENTFFTTYIYVDNSETFDRTRQTVANSIDPLIPPEYRLIVFFIPSIISFLINLVRILKTTRGIRSLLLTYPQFLLSPCFSPIMFEGEENEKNGYHLKIWRFGSMVNALFIGCAPQTILLLSEFYKGTPSWKFVGTDDENIFENNDALVKSPYGNIIFASVSMVLFFILIMIVFYDENYFSKGVVQLESKPVSSFGKVAEIVESPNVSESSSLQTNKEVNREDKEVKHELQSNMELNSEVSFIENDVKYNTQ